MLSIRRTLAFALVLGCCALAHADERAQAKEHYYKGTKAFELGLYEEAVTEYVAAYKAKDDPALLYNIAQAHRLAGHSAEALRFYKVYRSKVPGSPNRAEVDTKIDELEKLVEQQKKATHELPPDQVKPLGNAPEPVTPKAPEPPPVEPRPTATPTAPEVAAPAADAHAGRTKKIAGLAVAAVGVALVGVGAGLTAVAAQDASDLAVQYDPAKESSGKTFATVGPVLLGVGAAAAVAGVVVAVLGFREAKARRVAIAPTVAPRLAAASIEVKF